MTGTPNARVAPYRVILAAMEARDQLVNHGVSKDVIVACDNIIAAARCGYNASRQDIAAVQAAIQRVQRVNRYGKGE